MARTERSLSLRITLWVVLYMLLLSAVVIAALSDPRAPERITHSLRNLVAFHTTHKYLLLSHSETHYRQMGKLVAEGRDLPAGERFPRYEALLLQALALMATRRKHVNVLQHIMGYFKKQLGADEKQELLEIIGQYAEGIVPLVVPVTILNHFVRKYREPYLATQFYLHPHPIELQLRNHG